MNADIQNYIDKTKQMNSQLKILMAGGSFSEILKRCQNLRNKMETNYENSEQKYNELLNNLNSKTKSDTRLIKFKEKKEEIIIKDKREVDKLQNLAKSRLDTIKFKTLPKVKRDRETEALFEFFFVYLYREPRKDFDYDSFIKFALKKNVGEFKKRLALFEVRSLGKKNLGDLELVRKLEKVNRRFEARTTKTTTRTET